MKEGAPNRSGIEYLPNRHKVWSLNLRNTEIKQANTKARLMMPARNPFTWVADRVATRLESSQV